MEGTSGSSARIGGKSSLPLEALPLDFSFGGIFDAFPLPAGGFVRLAPLVVFFGALGMIL